VGITQPVWGGFACRLTYTTPMRRCATSAVPETRELYNFTAFSKLTAECACPGNSANFSYLDRTSNVFETALTSLDASASVNVTNYLL